MTDMKLKRKRVDLDLNSTDVLTFFSRSADKPPGKGAHEHVADSKQYQALRANKDWRHNLSNMDESSTFLYTLQNTPNGQEQKFRSIENAFQAEKIALASPTQAQRFTDLGNLASAKQAKKAHKIVLLTPEQLARWNAMSTQIMAAIARAKFLSPEANVARRVLLATQNAQLVHIETRRGHSSRLIPFTHLEVIRDQLRQK